MKRERKERGTYIGGHDAVAIIGRHPYREGGDVYAAMVNGFRPDLSGNIKIRRGLICEPGLLDVVEKDRGALKRDLHIVDTDGICAGTLDGVEVKTGICHDVTVTDTRSHAWESGLAEYKVLQLQHYMGIVENVDYCVSKNGIVLDSWPYAIADHSILTVFYADTGDIVHHVVWKDDKVIRQMRDAAASFMTNHVEKKIPPERVSNEVAKHVYPVDNGEVVEASEEFISAARQYISARDLAKEWDDAKKKCSAILRSHLGDNATSTWDNEEGSGKVTWKTSKGRVGVDHQQMARDLADKLGLGFVELCERYTKEKPGARTLRVTVREGEEA